MCEIPITIPDDSLAALAASPEAAGAELRMLAAVKLFELKKLSSGAAARLAGVSRVEFIRKRHIEPARAPSHWLILPLGDSAEQ